MAVVTLAATLLTVGVLSTTPAPLRLSSPALKNGGTIPRRFTCDGAGGIAGAGEFGDPAVAFSIDLHALGVGRLLTGSLTATHGPESIVLRDGVVPFSYAPGGSASTVSPVRGTYFDGRSAVFGFVTLTVDDGAYAG